MVTASIVIVLGPAVRVTAKHWNQITTAAARISPSSNSNSCATAPARTAAHQADRTLAAEQQLAVFTPAITGIWAIHLSGLDENRPLDAVVMAAWRTKILRLVRLTEYPLPE